MTGLTYELCVNRFYTVSVQVGNTTTAVNLGKHYALLIDLNSEGPYVYGAVAAYSYSIHGYVYLRACNIVLIASS